MRITTLNAKRGIYCLYNGSKYVIYSEFYGVVAESTKIERNDKKVTIDFNICQWYGYWDIKPIITRGIKKEETTFIEKNVTINYNVVKGKSENSLDKYLNFELLDR